jgi:hypothetical protein
MLSEIVTGLGGESSALEKFDTGWGNYQAEGRRFRNFLVTGAITIARLPHLSRFTLFSEPGYSLSRKEKLDRFFAWILSRTD